MIFFINWLKALRAPFLSASILSVFIGSLLPNLNHTDISTDIFVLSMFGVIFLHLGANLMNDYFDDRNGSDKENIDRIHPFTGGSRVIQDGLISSKMILSASLVFFLFAIVIGAILTIKIGWVIVIFGLLGISNGILYSFYFVSHYLGEVIVSISFGTLIVTGSYYAQTGQFSWMPVTISIPITIAVGMILWINQFPDYQADKKTGKHNLVVRLGRKKASIVFTLLMILFFISVFIVISIYSLKILYLLFLFVPLSFFISYQLLRFYDSPKKISYVFPLVYLFHIITGLIFIGAINFYLFEPVSF